MPNFCVAALEEAIARYGAPEIFNTDQGARDCQESCARAIVMERSESSHGYREGTSGPTPGGSRSG
jgi:hypothetical protein